MAWLAKPPLRASRQGRLGRQGMGRELASRRPARCGARQGEPDLRPAVAGPLARQPGSTPVMGRDPLGEFDMVDKVVRDGLSMDDLGEILARFSQRWLEHGIPLLTTGIGMPTIDPT